MRCLYFLLVWLPAVSVAQKTTFVISPKSLVKVVQPADLALKPLAAPQLPSSPFSRTAAATAIGCAAACSTLPVKWLSFQGERTNDSLCRLQWETTNEANNLGFEVERSLGNALHFSKAGFVQALQSAEPSLVYRFTDANDFAGITYYRLRQLDADGSFNYSKVIAVKGYTKNESLQVFPNPAQTNIQVSAFAQQAGRGLFVLMDGAGKMVLQKAQKLQKGSNVFQWEIGPLAKGIYLLQATTPEGRRLSSVVVKN